MFYKNSQELTVPIYNHLNQHPTRLIEIIKENTLYPSHLSPLKNVTNACLFFFVMFPKLALLLQINIMFNISGPCPSAINLTAAKNVLEIL